MLLLIRSAVESLGFENQQCVRVKRHLEMNQDCKGFVAQSSSWPFQKSEAKFNYLQSWKTWGGKRRSMSGRRDTAVTKDERERPAVRRCNSDSVSAGVRWRRLQLLRTLAIFFRLYCLKRRLTMKTCRTNPPTPNTHTHTPSQKKSPQTNTPPTPPTPPHPAWLNECQA